MFERIMFFIVLALCIFTPVGLVYAEDDSFYLDLANYKVIPKPPKLYGVLNFESWNTTANKWYQSENEACASFYSVAAGYMNREGARRIVIAGYQVSPDKYYCQLKRETSDQNANGTYGVVLKDLLNYTLQSKNNSNLCVVSSQPYDASVAYFVLGHKNVPPAVCYAGCVSDFVADPDAPPFANKSNSSGTGWPQPAGTPYTHIGGLVKRTDVSCELNLCSPDDPTCTAPPEDEEPPEDCTAEQKAANGGTCPTPDPDGNKCPDVQKTGPGGTCSGSGDGNGSGECTAEQKAANGGVCPAGAGGTCTANPINKKICDFIDAFSKPVPDATDGKVDVKNQTTTDVGLTPQQFDTNRVQFGAYCPPASVKTMSFAGESVSIEISYQPICDFLAFIKYIIIAAASFAAAYILSGVRS